MFFNIYFIITYCPIFIATEVWERLGEASGQGANGAGTSSWTTSTSQQGNSWATSGMSSYSSTHQRGPAHLGAGAGGGGGGSGQGGQHLISQVPHARAQAIALVFTQFK